MASGTKSDPIHDTSKDVTITPSSAAPTDVAISRNGNRYTLAWKRGNTVGNKSYASQEVRFRRKFSQNSTDEATYHDWSNVSVSATATSAYKDYPLTDYYPHTTRRLNAIQAEVRGTEQSSTTKSSAYKKNDKYYYYNTTSNPKASDYVRYTYDIATPKTPTISAPTATSSATAFPYSVSPTALMLFADVEWESRLVENWGTKDPSSGIGWSSSYLGYKSGTNSNTSATITVTEDTGRIGSTSSYSRIIRMRSRGAQGPSDWSYKIYVHAWPNVLATSGIAVSTKDLSGGYQVTVSFSPNRDDTHPCETFRVEYFIGTPANGSMGLPASPSWQVGASNFKDTNGKAAATFIINQQLTTDQALWVRVVQIHDLYEMPSDAKFVAFSRVTPIGPTDLSVTSYDSATKRLVLSCSNPSSIPTAYLRIWAYYWANGKWNQHSYCEIPHGSNSVTTTIDLNSYSSWAFDTYVCIGGGYVSAFIRTLYRPRSQATNPAAFAPNIGSVAAGSLAGTIVVKWANVMEGVTEARVTVADNETEWSKANPSFIEDVTITGNNVTSATVGGLEFGITYYVKVKTTNANGTSDWSSSTGIVTLSTTLAPVPVLTATETTDHFIKVAWDWSRWSAANSINISWSDKADFGKTDYKANEQTISRRGNNGTDSYTITDVERGKRWYIQAEFVSNNAVSNPGSAYCDLPVEPIKPTNITVVREAQPTDEAAKSTVRVSWRNLWEDADETEVSWSDNPATWEAVQGLSTYSLSGAEGRRESVLIPNLEMGKTWYFKVKLKYDGKFETSYNEVNPVSISLLTDPIKPILKSEASVVAETSHIGISWTYYCEDGGEQTAVDVIVKDEENTTVASFGLNGDEKSFAFYPETYGIVGNASYYITLRTISAYGRSSQWSDPIPVMVVHKPVATITATSLATGNILTALPLTVSVTGGENGTTTVFIERAQAFFEASPGEDQRGGYEGELMAVVSIGGEGTVLFDEGTLRSRLNDGASFRIVAIVTDEIGKSEPVSVDFTVHWTHQALMPIATRTVDEENNIVTIAIGTPTGAVEGDSVDIYRLSADKPELIVESGALDETYVDPFPAFGETGGHRVVYKTSHGDYTTAEGTLAWIDLDGSADGDDPGAETDARLDAQFTVIDFNNNTVELPYNLTLGHSWEKDFQETKYLGGSVQGDWNPAVSRALSVGTVTVSTADPERIKLMRRLSVWDGICHVRTPDGSSFAADVQVSENRSYETAGKVIEFSLAITRVDPEKLEGMTLAEWQGEGE